ncbi:hypothetical protein AVEN_162389-1 [Araneus ventricosus]|uniref:Uncharacterized protein n=1 Tax=Araneus ventricosus TaxID=182803 RepID=A0A4Y2GH14_ARAVE|nr:hypothetical protein AVEN_162389-1 [Araneus ventricosus]
MLDPLDKCCFRLLKAQWDKRLVEVQRMSGATKISKASFTQLVDELWPISLTPENIKSGFKSTGIYPSDRTKYPKARFCSQMIASYNLQNFPTKNILLMVHYQPPVFRDEIGRKAKRLKSYASKTFVPSFIRERCFKK